MRTRFSYWCCLSVFWLAGCAAGSPAGRSEVAAETEALSGTQCKNLGDCPVPEYCVLCDDGSCVGPTARCIKGRCVYQTPECPAYDPCDSKACGDICQLCDPNDPDCVETDVVKYCHANGSCSASQPLCTTTTTPCGPATCSAGEVCCNSLCGVCAANQKDCPDEVYCYVPPEES